MLLICSSKATNRYTRTRLVLVSDVNGTKIRLESEKEKWGARRMASSELKSLFGHSSFTPAPSLFCVKVTGEK